MRCQFNNEVAVKRRTEQLGFRKKRTVFVLRNGSSPACHHENEGKKQVIHANVSPVNVFSEFATSTFTVVHSWVSHVLFRPHWRAALSLTSWKNADNRNTASEALNFEIPSLTIGT